ncbi:hypothetical protein GZH53_09150 [Flavihumibacter sp. R14]|nr:hypothetical protein [Flavihumibacter soli]
MNFSKRLMLLLVLVAFMQVFVVSACKQKVAAAKPVPAVKPIPPVSSSKKAAACCKSGIPSRFGMPGVQPGKAQVNK